MENADAIYVKTLSQMADLDAANAVKPQSKTWNRLVDRLQDARRVLVASDEGRALIVGLLGDSRPTVRLWAASHALHWDDAKAREVLTAIASDQAGGVNVVSAKTTLREFDAGRLDPNW